MLIDWKPLGAFEKADLDVDAPWLLALEAFGDATHLRLEAEGSWSVAGSVLPECGPDGLPGVKLADDALVMSSCRFGALLGKIGGSTADHVVPEDPGEALAIAQPFAIGGFCILKLPEQALGPLYLGFNARTWAWRVKRLTVRISGARPTA